MRTVRKVFDEGDSGYTGYVFDRSEFPKSLPEDREEFFDIVFDIAYKHGIQLEAYYSGPGQAFIDFPGVLVGKYKVLVTQRWGLDI